MKQVLIGALMLTSMAFAQKREGQQPMNAEDRVEKMTERMSAELQLSDDQKKQVKELLAKQSEARKADMEERRAKMREKMEERKAFKAEMDKILTPEQKEKWEAIKKENREKIQEKRGEMQQKREKKKEGKQK